MNASRSIGHKEWAGPRKSDPRFSMDWFRGLLGKEIEEEEVEDMVIVHASKRASALLGPGSSFVGLSANELANFKAIGVREAWIEPASWDAYNDGSAFRNGR